MAMRVTHTNREMICEHCQHQSSMISTTETDQAVPDHNECSCKYCNCIQYALDYPLLSSLDTKKK